MIGENLIRNVRNRVNDVAAPDDETIYETIIEELLQPGYVFLGSRSKMELLKGTFDSLRRYGILQRFLDDDTITEIMVNGYDSIFVEQEGVIRKCEVTFENRDKLLDMVQRIAARSNKTVNETSPIIDSRLEDGSRVNIVMNPIGIDGPIITIRKFYDNPLTTDRLIELGAMNEEVSEFLERLVVSRYNIFISGGTGCGKTTFLNALSNFIPKNERVITIEDSAELKLMGIDNLVRLEARGPDMEGRNEVSIRDLIKTSLRMRPDRIIVGEVRGREALDMIQAMSSGHEGSISTGHSSGEKEMLMRLESMILMAADMPVNAIRSQLSAAIDIIIQLGRLRDGSRKLLGISEIEGIDDSFGTYRIKLHRLYEFKEKGVDENGRIFGCFEKKDDLTNKEKLLAAGYTSQ